MKTFRANADCHCDIISVATPHGCADNGALLARDKRLTPFVFRRAINEREPYVCYDNSMMKCDIMSRYVSPLSDCFPIRMQINRPK